LRLWVLDQHGPAKAAEIYPAAAKTIEAVAERWEGVSYDAMPGVYREIAASGGCVLSTSVREGMPLTLLEAQASGCLAVASDVPGNNECVLPSHGGILFRRDIDGDRLSALVAESLGDRQRVRARQDAATAFVRQQFSLERMAEHYVRIYRDAPYRAERDLRRLRARLRLSPVMNWGGYLEQRWGVGHQQFVSSRTLAQRGEWRLAAGAGFASLRTSPTIFLKPQRLAYLVSIWRRSTGLQDRPYQSRR
jgi:hypothetical protein